MFLLHLHEAERRAWRLMAMVCDVGWHDNMGHLEVFSSCCGAPPGALADAMGPYDG